MAKRNILVIEDDADILELIVYNLEKEGYTVATASSAEKALSALQKNEPNLILLDLMLPEMDGLELCRRLRSKEETSGIPIIMVTAKGEESDIVSGLELGADDYVTKPFRPKELIARVRAVIRRTNRPKGTPSQVAEAGPIAVDPSRRVATVFGKPVELTFTEFEVLHLLVRRAGQVFTRYQIVDAVRGEDYPVTDRAVDVQIVGLRRKLGKASSWIETVRGIGYRLKEPT